MKTIKLLSFILILLWGTPYNFLSTFISARHLSGNNNYNLRKIFGEYHV